MLPQGRGRWVVFQKRIMIHFVLGHIHYSSQVHICSDFITACAIKEASVNLITVPSLTTGSIACPWRGGKVLPKKTIAG